MQINNKPDARIFHHRFAGGAKGTMLVNLDAICAQEGLFHRFGEGPSIRNEEREEFRDWVCHVASIVSAAAKITLSYYFRWSREPIEFWVFIPNQTPRLVADEPTDCLRFLIIGHPGPLRMEVLNGW
jgi:hypothetical protein